MRIMLNGEPVDLDADCRDVAALLRQQALHERRVAVEVNQSVVPRSQHATQRLQEGDVVELVHALGGG